MFSTFCLDKKDFPVRQPKRWARLETLIEFARARVFVVCLLPKDNGRRYPIIKMQNIEVLLSIAIFSLRRNARAM